ncbi:hypothetical protein [Gephyromycinifex aptenodytis]|uniref:hypothetical protein n=1 Tax=Gephyromycinifex aptenodytis TaxID=2716227 RepID=UPI0014464D88|nr:hypothetical protein [Gephyromycinifex aptenodytis]
MHSLQARADLPSGPIRYVEREMYLDLEDAHHTVEVRATVAEGRPPYVATLGFGSAGLLALAFTRSGVFAADEPRRASHVLLADVEALIVDCRALAETAAHSLGYRGRVEMLVGIACDVPGQALRLRRLDHETGEMAPADETSSFEPIITSFDTDPAYPDRAKWCWDVAQRAADRFGAPAPQLVLPPAPQDDGTPKPAGIPGPERAAWRPRTHPANRVRMAPQER